MARVRPIRGQGPIGVRSRLGGRRDFTAPRGFTPLPEPVAPVVPAVSETNFLGHNAAVVERDVAWGEEHAGVGFPSLGESVVDAAAGTWNAADAVFNFPADTFAAGSDLFAEKVMEPFYEWQPSDWLPEMPDTGSSLPMLNPAGMVKGLDLAKNLMFPLMSEDLDVIPGYDSAGMDVHPNTAMLVPFGGAIGAGLKNLRRFLKGADEAVDVGTALSRVADDVPAMEGVSAVDRPTVQMTRTPVVDTPAPRTAVERPRPTLSMTRPLVSDFAGDARLAPTRDLGGGVKVSEIGGAKIGWEKEFDRPFVVVQKADGSLLPFYRSSGQQSGMRGTWLPFEGFGGVPRGEYLPSWYRKGPFTTGEFAKDTPLHRFGSEENKAISELLSRELGDAPVTVPFATEGLTAKGREAFPGMSYDALNDALGTYASYDDYLRATVAESPTFTGSAMRPPPVPVQYDRFGNPRRIQRIQ